MSGADDLKAAVAAEVESSPVAEVAPLAEEERAEYERMSKLLAYLNAAIASCAQKVPFSIAKFERDGNWCYAWLVRTGAEQLPDGKTAPRSTPVAIVIENPAEFLRDWSPAKRP